MNSNRWKSMSLESITDWNGTGKFFFNMKSEAKTPLVAYTHSQNRQKRVTPKLSLSVNENLQFQAHIFTSTTALVRSRARSPLKKKSIPVTIKIPN